MRPTPLRFHLASAVVDRYFRHVLVHARELLPEVHGLGRIRLRSGARVQDSKRRRQEGRSEDAEGETAHGALPVVSATCRVNSCSLCAPSKNATRPSPSAIHLPCGHAAAGTMSASAITPPVCFTLS